MSVKTPCRQSDVRIMARQAVASDSPVHDNPLLQRVLSARGITKRSELDFSLAQLPPPDTLIDIDKAVARLVLARQLSQRIVVVGDYDCDGATSTALALEGLVMLGFNRPDYLIPNRFIHGYGLTPEVVDLVEASFQPDLILTVDNGVTSVEAVQRASALGIEVIVTDHHLPPDELPEAVAIINPNLPGTAFPSQSLAGVGVMFYTLIALRAALAAAGEPAGKAPIASLLDLVAIGTVADLVPLDAVNRILVTQGLLRMRSGHTRPGVQALMNVARRELDRMCASDIGFGIGPRLNAAGRMDDMRVGVECLLSQDRQRAQELASSLDSWNQARRATESEMKQDAQDQLDALLASDLAPDTAFTVCLFDEHWHQGVSGIVAGRVKEATNLPTIIFSGHDGQFLKGSARSVSGVHIRDVLNRIATRHAGMIEHFGGHAMAAGLTLRKDNFEPFRQAFEAAVNEACQGRIPRREFFSDGSLSSAEQTLDNAALLASILPWGQGFEAPRFSDYFEVLSHREVGSGHLKLTLRRWGAVESAPIDAIAFNCDLVPAPARPVFALYALEINVFRDQRLLQLRVEHLEQAALR